MKLIINGDDFGLSEANTLGIIKAHKDGILTSTTMMTNMPYSVLAAELMKNYPKLGVGLHLTLTMGKPLLKDHCSIVDKDGKFRSQKDYYQQNFEIDYQEIEREYQAQMDCFIELTGQLPTHIDHHHSQSLTKEHPALILALAKKYNIPVRDGFNLYGLDYDFKKVDFVRDFYGDEISVDFFLENQANLLDYEVVESMCHPGYLDWDLYNKSSYNIQRMKELEILCDDSLKQWVKDHGIELINFRDIKN
jgi:Uncharacterized protein conserved in bacteria